MTTKLKVPKGTPLIITSNEDGSMTIEGELSNNDIEGLLKDVMADASTPDAIKKKIDDLSGQQARELITKISDFLQL